MRRTYGIYRQLKEIAASHLMLQFSKSLKCRVKLQRVMNPPHTGPVCTFPCSPRDLSVLLRREKQYLRALLGAGLNRGHFIRRKRSDITSKLVLFIKELLQSSSDDKTIVGSDQRRLESHGGGIVCAQGREDSSPLPVICCSQANIDTAEAHGVFK